jgi:hypothetical protein
MINYLQIKGRVDFSYMNFIKYLKKNQLIGSLMDWNHKYNVENKNNIILTIAFHQMKMKRVQDVASME